MRSNVRFWLALSLLLGAGAIVVWFKGRPDQSAAPVAWAQRQATVAEIPALLSTPSVAAALGTQPAKPESAAARATRYQLKNVDQPIEALTRVDSAILMRNALIDTRQPADLPIPADLRAGKNPGSYLVQADQAPTADFQNNLKAAGAEIIAYVPNNAFLVKAGSDVAANLQNQSGVRSVLPYEPYYKLDTRLMKFAVDHETMADDAWLRVTLFPGTTASALTSLAKTVGPTEASPFGQQVLIQPRAGVLADLAQLPGVQIIEPVNPRVVANDLMRVTLGVSEDTVTNANIFGLSGKDVWVNINDIGVDSNHTSIKGRVFYNGTNASRDIDGHGTHVAGTIAGDHATAIFDQLDKLGTNTMRTNVVIVTDEDGNSVTNTYVDGSLTNADFRGIAHEAKLFVLPIDFTPDVNEPVSDTFLIETAARTNYFTLKRTNETLISNNSWNYANTPEYDSQAARFDAATRDALPDNTASQPVLYVFAAGNGGFGGEDGFGGEPGSISSPGTAKNVITVGALEQPRFIAESLTNIEERTQIDDDGKTNTVTITNLVQIFRPTTDSANQVASYSARGNVGIGVEGQQGRFKPDLVAPGTFVWSARSKDWNLTNDFDPTDTNFFSMFNVLSNLNSISSEYRYDTGTSFAAPGVSGMLALVQEFFSHRLPQDRRRNLSPALMKALMINASRSVNTAYDWNMQGLVNYQGWGLVDLRNLITAADVPEGQPAQPTLEALQESDWPLQLIEQSPTNAVATGEERVWNITVDTNALGLPLRFTLVWTDPPGNPQVGVKLVNDLDLTVEVEGRVFHGNDFAPGSLTTEVRDPLAPGELAINDPFRDSINNVEKVVIGFPMSLTDTNGQPASKYTVRVSGRRVNVKAVNDAYSVSRGARTNEILQDFALVMSADNTFNPKTFTTIDRVDKPTVNTNSFVQPVFNGTEATNQRAGANPPLYWTNGNSVQWRFYTFTNSPNTNGVLTNAGRYVAFITSGPINVSKPRNIEPDLDMYVSKSPTLTNLNPVTLGNAWKSVSRFGTEQVVFAPDDFIKTRDASGNFVSTTNRVDRYDPQRPDLGGVVVGQADIGDVFYIGVKSEDQQAGEFSFIAISSDKPFEEDRNGIRIITMIPAPRDIPDGSANLPQGRRYYGIPLRGGKVLDANVYFSVNHEELGDLVGTIGHGARYATLNNHSLPAGFTTNMAVVYSSNPYAPSLTDGGGGYFYNDPQEYPNSSAYYNPLFPRADKPLLFQPDGPIDLSTYVGVNAAPVWTFDMADSAAAHTGTVSQAEVHVTPLRKLLLSGETVAGTVRGPGQDFYPFEVPIDGTRVTITLTLDSGAPNANVQLIVSRDGLPSTNNFDYFATAAGSSTVTITFDRNSQPPLNPGDYIVGIINKGLTAVSYHLTVTIEADTSGLFREELGSQFVRLTDDARTVSGADFFLDRIITEASVAILSTNIRQSDYVFRLTSPQGTSVILSENRGWFDQNGFGSASTYTNADGLVTNSYAIFSDDIGSMIKFTPPPFGDSSPTRGFVFGSSFEKALEGTYLPPAPLDDWTVTSNSVYAVWGDAADGSMFVNLGIGGALSNTLPTVKGRPYKLSFAYRGKPSAASADAALDFSHTANPNGVWTYGFKPAAGGPFTVMPNVAKVNSNPDVWFWQGLQTIPPFYGEPTIGKNEGTTTFGIGGSTFYRPGELALHPGPGRERATLRWTAPSAGAFHVVASFKGGDRSTTTEALIDVNGTQVFAADITGNLTARSNVFDATMSAGGIIDFMVGTKNDYSFDTTITSVTITSPLGAAFSTGQVDPNGAHTNLPMGSVDRHYRVINNPDPNFAPPPFQDGSSLFVANTNTAPFPAWFPDDSTSQWIALKPLNDAGHPQGLYTNRTSFVLTGVNPLNVYVRARIAADDTINAVLVNNTPISPTPVAGPAGYSGQFDIRGLRTGLNTIDFVVANTSPGAEGFRADLSMGFDVKGQVQSSVTNTTFGYMRLTGGGNTTPALFTVNGSPQWERFEVEFVAPADNTGIEFFARTNFPGVDIDDIVLEDTGTKFLLPEEPLEILKGERAMGAWKLEAIDSRTGGVNPSIIVDWQLLLGVALPTRLAEPLESGVPYPAVIHNPVIKANTNVYTPGRIRAGETEYFYFDVCNEATEAKIELFASKTNSIALELLVDRSGFPTGDPERDDYQIIRTTPGTNSTITLPLTLTQPVAAPLLPGKRIFIAVRGARFPLTTNETFSIRVLPNGCGPIAPIFVAAGDSVSGASFPSPNSAGGTGDGDGGTSFETSTNAVSVEVTSDGPLTFLAANGFEPSLSNYQIKQPITAGTVKIPLTPGGHWFFRVINESGETISYTLAVEAEAQGTTPSIIRTVALVDNQLTVTWESVPGASYEIATSTDLITWTPLTTVQASSNLMTYVEPANETKRFIRIRPL